MADKIITTKALSSLLNVTSRRIQQLSKDGVLVKDGKDKYPMVENIHRYIKVHPLSRQ